MSPTNDTENAEDIADTVVGTAAGEATEHGTEFDGTGSGDDGSADGKFSVGTGEGTALRLPVLAGSHGRGGCWSPRH